MAIYSAEPAEDAAAVVNVDQSPGSGDTETPEEQLPTDPKNPIYNPEPVLVDDRGTPGGSEDPDDPTPGAGPDISNLDPDDWEMEYALTFNADGSTSPPPAGGTEGGPRIGIEASVSVDLVNVSDDSRYRYTSNSDIQTILDSLDEDMPTHVDVRVYRETESGSGPWPALPLWSPQENNWIVLEGEASYRMYGLNEDSNGHLTIGGGKAVTPQIHSSDTGTETVYVRGWIDGKQSDVPDAKEVNVSLEGME